MAIASTLYNRGDVYGFVFHVTKYPNGNAKIGFYDKDKDAVVY